MFKKKTIIFDMDGVIVDAEPYHCQAWIEACREIGINIDEKFYFSKVCGNHSLTSAKMLLEQFNKNNAPDDLVDKKSFYAQKIISLEKINAFPGVLELVNFFNKKKYRIGLVSSSSYPIINTILSKFKIKSCFSLIHGPERSKQGKPDPEPYVLAAKILSVEPWDCVVLEDSKSGVVSAKRAGAKCIAYLNGHNRAQDLGLADHITNSFFKINERLINNL
ncbi:MAG: HAD family phosphatase [bacterium]